jgi:ATP-dependent Clp protease ATP-binding subunit ClpA
VLGSFGITWGEVRAQVVRIVGQGDEVITGQISFTEHATNVLNLAQRESLSLGNDFIGPEHILLGVVGEREGRAAEILDNLAAGARRSGLRSFDGSADPAYGVRDHSGTLAQASVPVSMGQRRRMRSGHRARLASEAARC